MYMIVPLTDKEKKIREIEKEKRLKIKTVMIDVNGNFNLNLPKEFNILLGYSNNFSHNQGKTNNKT